MESGSEDQRTKETAPEHDGNGDGGAPATGPEPQAEGGGRGVVSIPRRRLLPKPPTPPDDGDPPTRPKLRKLRIALVLLGLAALAFVSWIFGIMMAVAQDIPSLETRQQYARAQNSVVYDVNGERVATLTNNQGRILLTSGEISPILKEAVVAIEDTRFYAHRGIDFQGMARALYQDILSGSAQQGASTITQQFVKNALAAQENRTVLQKFREAAIAYHLERQWSKDKILTEYLNEIYFGEGATGVEAAARTFFGGVAEHAGCGEGEDATPCASDLLPWEAALLAGMISSPSAYNPIANPEDALARRNLVLRQMTDQGFITEEEYADYSNPELHPLPDEEDILPPREDSEAPYFTSWLRQQLVDRYGAGEAFGGGLQITSTLDLDFQNQVQSIAQSRAGGVGLSSSVVVLDNDTAAVRAMVGGFDFQKSPFNLATNGHRQPGSAFKPFTLITALNQGVSTSTTFTSAPQEIPFRTKVPKKNGNGSKEASEIFEVNNYNDSYLGAASLVSGTTYSDNSVYSQLGTQVGVQNVAATAHDMGIDTDLSTPGIQYSIQGGPWQPYNPALILGGLQTGVTPLEMAHAYNTLAADGNRITGTMASGSDGPLGIVEVTDGDSFGDGAPVPDDSGASGKNSVETKQVIPPEVASTAQDILSTVITSGTGKNANTGETLFGKTGTTDDNGDAWFCGVTEEITACVWVGHAESNTPMLTEFGGAPVDGGTIPALIFADVVNAYESIMATRDTGEDPETTEPVPVAPTSAEPAGPAPADTDAEDAPADTTDSAPAEPATEAPPADAGGGAPPAPSGGGVSPG
jgi:penicillin-binding protein 1A